MSQKKHLRATAIVKKDDRYLIVLDRGRKLYSLPGGGIERGEPSVAAAAREVYEETGLTPSMAKFLFRYEGSVSSHWVVLVEVRSTEHVKLQRKELDDYKWYRLGSSVPVSRHVTDILGKVKQQGW